MFILLRDYLKKIDEKLKKEEDKENIINENQELYNESSEDNLVEDEELEELEELEEQVEARQKTRREIKKEKKKEKKREKKEKRKKKKKPITLYSVLLALIFIIIFLSRIYLLTTAEEYILDGQIIYSSKLDRYVINYDIEELWNDNRLSVGEKVCIPQSYDKNDTAIKNYSGKCISGEIIESGNRVKIKYDLPKYVSYEELKLYVSKDNFSKHINIVKIKIKHFNNLYQITEIIPIT